MKRAILFLAVFASVFAVKAQNVGISDVLFTPNTRLHVRGTSGTNATLTVERTTATTSAILLIPESNLTTFQSQATATSTTARDMRFNVGTTEAMRIITSGNVGIGTATPGSKLTVIRTTAATASETTGTFSVNWATATTHAYALSANASKGSAETSGRSTGVYAVGGNATNQWNTGVSAVLIGTNQGAAIVAGSHADYITYGYGGSFQPQYVNPAGQWGIVSYSPVYFHRDHYVMGNMGVNVAAPTSRLHVNGTVRLQGLAAPAGETTALVIDANGNVKGRTLNAVAFDGVTVNAWNLTGNAALATNFIGTTNAVDFRMFTNNTERMRITSAGNVGIGITAPTALLHVVGRTNIVHSTSPSLYVQNDANSFANLAIQVFGQGSQRAFIASNGGAFFNGNVGIGTTNPTYKLHVIGRFKSDGINETSDVRLKKNIEPLQNSLDKILAMQGVTYEWNKEGMEEGVQIGLIAQEVEQILPEIVDTDSEGFKSIQYSVLVAVLIEGMKEQQAEYDALLLKVQQLESDMATIKAMMGIGEVEGEISVSR